MGHVLLNAGCLLGRRTREGRRTGRRMRTATLQSANSVRDGAHGTAITEPHPRFRRSYRKSGYEPDPRGPGVSETFADIYRFTIRFARQEF
jgi:hypothetical protein